MEKTHWGCSHSNLNILSEIESYDLILIYIHDMVSSTVGPPCSGGVHLLSMLGKAPPTTSHQNLVNSEVPNQLSDVPDGITMAELVESLDTRELDIEEGEEIDYDGNILGLCFLIFLGCLILPLLHYLTWTYISI